MDRKTFTPAGNSALSPREHTRRKEVPVTPLECWIGDYETEIDVRPTERYNLRHGDGSVNLAAEQFARFKLHVPLRANTDVIIDMRFKLVNDIDMYDNYRRLPLEDAVKMKPVVEEGVEEWNGVFKLHIIDPKCGTRIFPIHYRLSWVDDGHHFEVRVKKTMERERVVDNAMIISTNTTAHVVTHEFGHCLGLPDEYAAIGGMNHVTYISPDGSNNTKIATPEKKNASDTDSSLMSTYDSREFFPRHAWNIAIETQALLTKELGRKIKCEIFLA